MTIHNTNNLRLEVEVPGTGLPNLIQNPSGEKGAWGWATPVSNTTLTTGTDSAGTYLKFLTTVSQATYFTSEFLPVAATKYVAARIDGRGQSANTYLKFRFDWYDVNKALLSSSVQSGYYQPTAGTTFYVSSVQAPANTAYVKIRTDMYGSTLAANPAANSYVQFSKAMVTWADTNAGLGSSRTNLITNPSVETNITLSSGWDAYQVDDTVVPQRIAPTGGGAAGTYAGRVTTFEPYYIYVMPGTNYPTIITPGKAYTFQAQTKALTVGRSVWVRFRWFDTNNFELATSASIPAGSNNTSTWTRHTGTATAPSKAHYCRPEIVIGTTATNESHYVDAALLEIGNVAGGYFDGSTVKAGNTYAWTGTAHGSTSTEVADQTAYAYSEPVYWRNILGPTHEISIDRGALDVGTLSATIYDAMLDPAVSSDIKPGKKMRLTADYDGDDVWDNIFEGRLTKAHTSYNMDKSTGIVNAKVELSASDNITVLANQAESRGMATITNLPYILEGKGVPWEVDGSGNQVASAAVVSTNENASLLDQIAITRDSVLGYAWVDRNNILKAKTTLASQNLWFFTDVPGMIDSQTISYTDIDATFDTDECINEVNVSWLRYTPSTGETEEVAYGPYRNQSSIDTWGAYSATFTITGATESASAIATYANNILTANATPVIKANSLTFVVDDTTTMRFATQIDLYDRAGIVYSDKINNQYNITSVNHSITPEAWTVTLEFGSTSSVAAPNITPSPQGTTVGLDVNVWYTVTPTSPYTTTTTVRYLKDTAGNVHVRGAVIKNTAADGATCFTLPVGFRPTSETRVSQDTVPVGTSSSRIVYGSDGTVKCYLKTGTPTTFFLDAVVNTL